MDASACRAAMAMIGTSRNEYVLARSNWCVCLGGVAVGVRSGGTYEFVSDAGDID